ncbi:hypothetical protein BDW68DRAFT_169407 [Aspergillus falconensis]
MHAIANCSYLATQHTSCLLYLLPSSASLTHCGRLQIPASLCACLGQGEKAPAGSAPLQPLILKPHPWATVPSSQAPTAHGLGKLGDYPCSSSHGSN